MWVNRICSGSSVRRPRRPGDLAPVAVLGLVGDAHPFRPGLLAEAGGASGGAGLAFLAVDLGQLADDRDLLAVDDHGRVAGEPIVGKATGDPLGRVARIGLL